MGVDFAVDLVAVDLVEVAVGFFMASFDLVAFAISVPVNTRYGSDPSAGD